MTSTPALFTLAAVLLAFTSSATTLTVNKPLTESLTEAQIIQIEGDKQIAEQVVALFETKLTFTLPSERPVYDDFKDEILVLTADTDGTILIADGGTPSWVTTKTKVTDTDEVDVRAKGYLKEGTLTFDITLNNTETIHITAPKKNATALSEIELIGEGAANGLSLAIVDTSIIPPTTDASLQDDELIAKYITWLNDDDKGGAMPQGATPEDFSDAFAMNVGGTPSLQIIAVDPSEGTVTLQGFKTVTTDEKTDTSVVPLGQKNGTIYLVYSETLNGTAQVTEAEIKSSSNDAIVVKLPTNARFVKAAVSLKEPEKAL